MGRLIRIAGNHGMAAICLSSGRHAGRHAIAFRFYGRWRFITDEESGDLLTWKTEEEALGNAEAWRRWWDTLTLPGDPRRASRRAAAEAAHVSSVKPSHQSSAT